MSDNVGDVPELPTCTAATEATGKSSQDIALAILGALGQVGGLLNLLTFRRACLADWMAATSSWPPLTLQPQACTRQATSQHRANRQTKSKAPVSDNRRPRSPASRATAAPTLRGD